jgi:hypothetical protein
VDQDSERRRARTGLTADDESFNYMLEPEQWHLRLLPGVLAHSQHSEFGFVSVSSESRDWKPTCLRVLCQHSHGPMRGMSQ